MRDGHPGDRLVRSLVIATATVAAALGACVSDAPPTGAPCGEYCERVTATRAGPLRAYDNAQQCRSACVLMPSGAAENENSVECRLRAAQSGGDQATCSAASAFGGDACGSRCDAFCELVTRNCIEPLGNAGPYRSKADCVEACGAMRYDPALGEGTAQPIDGDDTLNCRMLHLLLSLGDRAGHCPHVAAESVTCRPRG